MRVSWLDQQPLRAVSAIDRHRPRTRLPLVYPGTPGTLGWATAVDGLSSGTDNRVIAPDGHLLAAAAALTPERTQLCLLALSHQHGTPVLVPDSIAPTFRLVGWTIHGDWLILGGGILGRDTAQTTGVPRELRAYQLDGSTRTLAISCCHFATMLIVP